MLPAVKFRALPLCQIDKHYKVTVCETLWNVCAFVVVAFDTCLRLHLEKGQAHIAEPLRSCLNTQLHGACTVCCAIVSQNIVSALQAVW